MLHEAHYTIEYMQLKPMFTIYTIVLEEVVHVCSDKL